MNPDPQTDLLRADVGIAEFRALRRRARELYRDLRDDLVAFQQPDGTFSTYPPPKGDKIHVTTTCTSLMALAIGREIDRLYPSSPKDNSLVEVFKKVVAFPWQSEGLERDNAFSVALVLRAAGFFVREVNVSSLLLLQLKHDERTLEAIVKDTVAQAAKDFTDAFGVRIPRNDPAKPGVAGQYPPKAAMVYWFVDAIDALGVEIDEPGWTTFVRWATREFNRQIAYVAAMDDALMDPISMGMAACLVARLQKIMNKRASTNDSLAQLFPSRTELKHSISLLFRHQQPSGIWPKYFPMFHFQTAGANYCFTFEMLEALVSEMDPTEIFDIPRMLTGLSNAVNWCFANRLRYKQEGKEYRGWNSGGSITTVLEGKAESWATATVHWFLHKLDESLSDAINHNLLHKYDVSKPVGRNHKDWTDLADADVEIQSAPTTVKNILEDQFITPLTQPADRRTKIRGRRSALLFGPPGTAKTSIVRRLAAAIGWPCVEIRPSNFLRRGLDSIYVVADEIFEDLMDLSRVVIFFDEMDALVQSRSVPLDATRQFLTTSMLPKLAELHDQGRSIFFVATNYRTTFDEAITRPGRFDLLLLVGPPSWPEKLRTLESMVTSTSLGRELVKGMKSDETKEASMDKLREKLRQWAEENDLREKLSRFTYGEMASLLEELLKSTGEKSSLAIAADKLDKKEFASKVKTWTTKYIILRDFAGAGERQNETYANYLLDQSASRMQ